MKKEKRIKQIWKTIISAGHLWKELKPKLLKLLELGDGILPLFFDINYDSVQIEVFDGEYTITVFSDEYDKLKGLKTIFKKELDRRMTPYGLGIGKPKIEWW